MLLRRFSFRMMGKNSRHPLSFSVLAAVMAFAFVPSAFCADEKLFTAADIAFTCYAVGDTVTIADGSAAAVFGDCVASLDGQTITMKRPGFTLLKDADGTEYVFGAYEMPGEEGDVFLFNWSTGGVNWDSAEWTKLTQNSNRTYPNHADDVAMVLNVSGNNYQYLTIPVSGITIGQFIVGMAKHWTLNHTTDQVSPLIFSRTDGGTPRYSVSFVSSTDTSGTFQMRVGEYERDNNGNVLAISFLGPLMEIDLCGDSAAAAGYSRKPIVCFAVARSKFEIGEGQTLRVLGGSRNTGNNTDYLEIRGRLGSGFFGAGTLEIRDVAMNCQLSSPDDYVKVGLYRAIPSWSPFDGENNTTRFTTRFNTVPSVPIEILSARCPTNVNAQTGLRNYWSVGVADAWLSPSVLLSGCNYEMQSNPTYAPHWDYYEVTNKIDKLTIRGHVGLYGPSSYTRDTHVDEDGVQQGRVTHHIDIEKLELYDRWSTARVNGLNFNRGDDRTNDVKGTLTIGNWSTYIRRPAGINPSDYDGTVYAIIPWMTVHCNDNNQVLTDNDWGTEQTFPGVRETDGCIRLLKSQLNSSNQTLWQCGENDNFYFFSNSGFNLNGADRRIFSLVYSTKEMPHYVPGGNFYIDTAKGGHKLIVTSGAMAITRLNKWLGQPADMTRNGKIVLEGDPAYLHVPSAGILTQQTAGSSASDYNMCWVPLMAENDLVKGGAGSVGLAGDQRGIRGTLVVNGGQLWLGYPSFKKNGYLYLYGNPESGWPMHGCATDCDFIVRGGAVLALCAPGYQGLDSDGNEVNAPVLAFAADQKSVQHTITLERSGDATGGLYLAEGVEAHIWKCFVENETGTPVSLARGMWGSSESVAENVDDALFAGSGILIVQKDDYLRPTIIIVR